MIGTAFAPRIKKIGKQTLSSFSSKGKHERRGDTLLPGHTINKKLILSQWDDILRFMATIKLRHSSASQLFKRLSSYAKDHPLYRALKEFGRIIKTQFILTYFDDLELRQRIAYLSTALREEGLHLLVGDNFYSPTEEMELLRMLLGHRPAGIVMVNSAHSDSGRELLLKSGVPVIEAWDLPMRPLGGVVGFSHNNVGFAMTEHLISCGHKKIAFVSGPEDSDPRGKERYRGHLRAMTAHQLDGSRLITIDTDPLEISAGKKAIDILQRNYPDTDALVCLTDRVAMGAMMECKRRDLNIPNDLAITGHGGFDFAEHLVPALTTTRIDAANIGVQSARLLIDKINDREAPSAGQYLDVGFEIVPRESTLGK